jgi:predicted nuclease of restriction endonuclease-like (RecB) superfamily
VEKTGARAFYEIEAIRNNWSARELERQINSLLFERLALSKNKKGLMRLATKGQVIQRPGDVFKDPVVMEFLGLPASPKLVESHLEEALINNLQAFLLELGKGFAFMSRQERITLANQAGVKVDRLIAVYAGTRPYHFAGLDVLPVSEFLQGLHQGEIF